MTRELRAFAAAPALLALTGALVAALLAIGSSGVGRYFVPSPDTTAEEVLRALEAHRYQAAFQELSEEAKAQSSEEDLRELVKRIEERTGGIIAVTAETTEDGEDEATAKATVKLDDGGERELELALVKQQEVWKVASLDPIRALAAR